MNVVGHRGASGAEPENTPAAFATADRMGADGVELDVRIAPDGRGGNRLVVFHDPLARRPGRRSTGSPSFDDVLDACGDRMLVNVEIKNSADDGGHDPTMAVVAADDRCDAPPGTGMVAPVADLVVLDVRRSTTAARSPRTSRPRFLVHGRRPTPRSRQPAAGGHRAIHPWVEGSMRTRVEACHAAGLVVNTWTCNDPGPHS